VLAGAEAAGLLTLLAVGLGAVAGFGLVAGLGALTGLGVAAGFGAAAGFGVVAGFGALTAAAGAGALATGVLMTALLPGCTVCEPETEVSRERLS
jgi:hypothetical protein